MKQNKTRNIAVYSTAIQTQERILQGIIVQEYCPRKFMSQGLLFGRFVNFVCVKHQSMQCIVAESLIRSIHQFVNNAFLPKYKKTGGASCRIPEVARECIQASGSASKKVRRQTWCYDADMTLQGINDDDYQNAGVDDRQHQTLSTLWQHQPPSTFWHHQTPSTLWQHHTPSTLWHHHQPPSTFWQHHTPSTL